MRLLLAALVAFMSLTVEIVCFDLSGERSLNETAWRFTDKGYKFNAKNLTVNETNTALTSANGFNDIQSNVTILSIRSEILHYLPEDVDKFFPDVQGLEIFNCSLKVLEQKNLKPFEKLRELWVSQNKLTTLSADLFKFNGELQLIVFSKNQLMSIGKYILIPLTKLQIANFNKNKCIDHYAGFPHQMHELFVKIERNCAPPENLVDTRMEAFRLAKPPAHVELVEAKSEIKELRQRLRSTQNKLSLSDGHLNAAMKNLFVASKALEARGNSREEFMTAPSESQFVDLACYTDVDSVCEADDLKIRFNNMKILGVIGASGQSITLDAIKEIRIVEQQTLFLPTNLEQHFSELKKLTVTLSGLFTIKWNVFADLRKLQLLDLSHNKVHEIPANAFGDLESLTELDLSFNYVELIENDGFKGIDKLQNLKLNHNYLRELSGKPFEHLKQLQKLFLQRNYLTVVDGNLLTPLLKLVEADFSSNECIDTSFPNNTLESIQKEIKDKCARRP